MTQLLNMKIHVRIFILDVWKIIQYEYFIDYLGKVYINADTLFKFSKGYSFCNIDL